MAAQVAYLAAAICLAVVAVVLTVLGRRTQKQLASKAESFMAELQDSGAELDQILGSLSERRESGVVTLGRWSSYSEDLDYTVRPIGPGVQVAPWGREGHGGAEWHYRAATGQLLYQKTRGRIVREAAEQGWQAGRRRVPAGRPGALAIGRRP